MPTQLVDVDPRTPMYLHRDERARIFSSCIGKSHGLAHRP
jgi:hypothetical protein